MMSPFSCPKNNRSMRFIISSTLSVVSSSPCSFTGTGLFISIGGAKDFFIKIVLGKGDAVMYPLFSYFNAITIKTLYHPLMCLVSIWNGG